MTGLTFVPSSEPQFRRVAVLAGPGISLVVQLVPERKKEKNRVHLDIEVADVEAGLTQVEGLGGRLVPSSQ